jgi:ABC-type transport system substrate-binding protein
MKKILALILSLTLVFALAACGGDEVSTEQKNQEAVDAAKTALALTGIDAVTADFTLDVTGDGEVTIDWLSDNKSVIAIDGNTAKVTRPAVGEADAMVTLTATLRKGFASANKTFDVTVKAIPATDADKLAEAVAALEFPVNAFTVKEDFELPAGGANNASITWVSSDAVVTVGDLDGDIYPATVARPDLFEANVELTVTATLTIGTETATKVFDVLVLAKPVTPADQVAEAVDNIELGNLSFVTADFDLPAMGIYDSEIEWASNKTAVIDISDYDPVYMNYTAEVTRPAANTVVILTATVTIGDASEDVSFTAVVIGTDTTYTWRDTTLETDTLNPHTYEMTHESTAMSYFMSSLYEFAFKTDPYDGFEIVPEMAAGEPTDVSPVDKPGTVWQIDLAAGLKWADGEAITADDFIESYKRLLDPRMANYRGDAFHTGLVVVGAKEYFSQDVSGVTATENFGEGYTLGFDTVGIEKIDADTIQFTLVSQATAWDLKYNLSSPITGVIDVDLYDANLSPEKDITTYGTELSKLRANGAFKFVEWQKGKVLYFEANENYIKEGTFATTHIRLDVIKDQSVILQLFNQGKLDTAGVGSTEYDNYKNDSRLKLIESTVTWRLVINGDIRPDNKNEDGTVIDKSKLILTDINFRKALYHVFDRAELASTLAAPATPSQTLLSTLYLVDVAAGTSYRGTEAGESVVNGLYPDTTGFNLTEAQALFDLAYDKMVADGNIADGDTIELDILNYTAETSIARNNWAKAQIEDAFNTDTETRITVSALAVPDRYDKYEAGNYDFGWAGWSGMALDPLGFMIVWYHPAYRSEYSFDVEQDITVTYDFNDDGTETDMTMTYEEWFFETNPAFEEFVDTGVTDDPDTDLDESIELESGTGTEADPYVYKKVMVGGTYYGPDADGTLRTWILAAMERNIIDQGVVVPLYQNRSAVIYSNRVQFPVTSYQPIMGYGAIKDYTYSMSDQDLGQ